MRQLKQDSWTPSNSIVYCVSKVLSPVMPNGYDEQDTFAAQEVWSAWSFLMPKAKRFTYEQHHPIVAYLHGSSGWVSSDVQGYNSATTSTSIVGRLRSAGCVVLDINGYGISEKEDYPSSNWGCPLAVETLKKAYTVLADRFCGGAHGFVLSGISMGGALAKSYCMRYPQDVIACALLAPSEMGLSGRTVTYYGQAYAWGYASPAEMRADVDRANLIGYTPLIKPCVIGENGALSVMAHAGGYTVEDMLGNLSGFFSTIQTTIKIWHGTADESVPYNYSVLFVNTLRNGNCDVTLRTCVGEGHGLDSVQYIKDEFISYILDKIQ